MRGAYRTVDTLPIAVQNHGVSDTPRTRLSPDARRRQIIDAARDLYRERRYDDVSMEDLAQAAGVARGLLHHYFGSKRDIFLAVMTQSVRLPVVALPDLDGRPVDERARLTMAWILEGARTFGHEWVNAAGAETLHDGGDVQALVDAADDRAARFVMEALGLPDDDTVRARLRPVAPFIKALCRAWLQQESLTFDDVLEASTAAVLQAVRA